MISHPKRKPDTLNFSGLLMHPKIMLISFLYSCWITAMWVSMIATNNNFTFSLL